MLSFEHIFIWIDPHQCSSWFDIWFDYGGSDIMFGFSLCGSLELRVFSLYC